MKTVYGYFYHKEFKIPVEAVYDCSHQGACDEDVAYWQPRIAMNYWTREQKIEGLAETGGWTRDELRELTEDKIEEKILWIACGDLKDSGELEGE